ncbi:10266_t:CDS:2, partial [Acaulospora colombiana]
ADVQVLKRSTRLQLGGKQPVQKPQVDIHPEGTAIEPEHRVVKLSCWDTEDHKLLGSCDNLNLFLVFSLLGGAHAKSQRQASSTIDCPQYWDYIKMLEEPVEYKLVAVMNFLLAIPLDLWRHGFIATMYDAIYECRDARLVHLLREEEFLRKSERVEMCGIQFGEGQRQRGIVATSHIPKGTYLWELCGVISSDVMD